MAQLGFCCFIQLSGGESRLSVHALGMVLARSSGNGRVGHHLSQQCGLCCTSVDGENPETTLGKLRNSYVLRSKLMGLKLGGFRAIFGGAGFCSTNSSTLKRSMIQCEEF